MKCVSVVLRISLVDVEAKLSLGGFALPFIRKQDDEVHASLSPRITASVVQRKLKAHLRSSEVSAQIVEQVPKT